MRFLFVVIICLIFNQFGFTQELKKKDIRGVYNYKTGAPARTIGTSDTTTISIPESVFSNEDLKLSFFGVAKRSYNFSNINQNSIGWEKGTWRLSGDTVKVLLKNKEYTYQFEHVYLKAIDAPHGYQKK